jgi:hypothetical protein
MNLTPQITICSQAARFATPGRRGAKGPHGHGGGMGPAPIPSSDAIDRPAGKGDIIENI